MRDSRYILLIVIMSLACLHLRAQEEGVTVKDQKIGINNTTPNKTLEVSAADNPTLRLSQGQSTSSYLDIIDGSATIAHLMKFTATGNSLIDLDPRPLDGISQAAVRLFRSTNTSAPVSLQIMQGINAPSPNHMLAGNRNSYMCRYQGNLGIGKINPEEKLDVDGNILFNNSNYLNGKLTTGENHQLIGLDLNNSLVINRSSIVSNQPTSLFLGVGEGKTFDIRGPANSTLLTLKENSGNLGVGVSAPVEKFEVAGHAKIRHGVLWLGDDATIGDAAVKVGRYRKGVGHAYIDLTNDNVNYAQYGARFIRWKSGATSIVHRGVEGFYIQAVENAPIIFHLNGSSRYVFNSTSIRPDADNTYTLGTNTFRWKDIWSANGVQQTSDRRLKSNIADIEYGIKDVMQLRPVSFQWTKDSTHTYLGFIAQEVQTVVGEVVSEDGNSAYLSMNYAELIPLLVKGMQEQQEMIDQLQSKNSLLEARITKMEKKHTVANHNQKNKDK